MLRAEDMKKRICSLKKSIEFIKYVFICVMEFCSYDQLKRLFPTVHGFFSTPHIHLKDLLYETRY